MSNSQLKTADIRCFTFVFFCCRVLHLDATCLRLTYRRTHVIMLLLTFVYSRRLFTFETTFTFALTYLFFYFSISDSLFFLPLLFTYFHFSTDAESRLMNNGRRRRIRSGHGAVRLGSARLGEARCATLSCAEE